MVNTARLIRETCNDGDGILQNAAPMLLLLQNAAMTKPSTREISNDASQRSVLGYPISVQEEPLHFTVKVLHFAHLPHGSSVET